MKRQDNQLIEAIQTRMNPLQNSWDLSPLVEKLSRAKIVMLGEATHGTHDFYELRRKISMELLTRYGFNFIAVEADWPPSFELNRYLHSIEGNSLHEAISHFNRWPTWMWANREVIRLVEEMRNFNMTSRESKQIGFYGLDVYSLFESIDALLGQLEKINPFMARKAKVKYGCFGPYLRDERAYAKSLWDYSKGCEREVNDILQDLLRIRLNGLKDREEILFDVQQNARIIANAESYYRTMIQGNEDSWNVRDRHMMETLDLLLNHYGDHSKGIVWAHNTHIGDYRATDMLREGQINIGGLARQEWGEEDVALVGFGTFEGQVIASRAWKGPIETVLIPPGRDKSYEAAFHQVAAEQGENAFYLLLDDTEARSGPLAQVCGHRAIGVVYHPEFEHFGNYVPTSLSFRYDAFIFVDRTTAVEPLIQNFIREEIPQTWPRGL